MQCNTQCTVCDQDFKPNCTFKSHMKKHHHRASPPSEAFSQCNPIYTMQCHTQCYTQCNTLHTGILYIWDILWFQSNHSCTPFLALNNALCVIKILSQAILLRVTWKKQHHNTTQLNNSHQELWGAACVWSTFHANLYNQTHELTTPHPLDSGTRSSTPMNNLLKC